MNLSIHLQVIIFIVSAIAIWAAGVSITKATATLDSRFKLGDALGGLILLGIVVSLPEIAIVMSAALRGNYEVIIGNLIGGIAIQTVVIAILDIFVKGKKPLTYLAGSTILVLEGLFVLAITLIATLGLGASAKGWQVLGLNPISILLIAAWVVGLYLINRARLNPNFHLTARLADPGRKHRERRETEHRFFKGRSTAHVLGLFLFSALIILIAGVMLEQTGSNIASSIGLSSGLFAATIMAFVAALPEISTGIESIIIGDNLLAVSDIFGGNAFMPSLFLLGDILAGESILAHGTAQDIGFGIMGIVLTIIYIVGLIYKPKGRFLRLGYDSIFVVLIYAIGLFLLM